MVNICLFGSSSIDFVILNATKDLLAQQGLPKIRPFAIAQGDSKNFKLSHYRFFIARYNVSGYTN